MSVLGLVAITSFFNATATRDYTSGMDQIVFASPIKKIHFFFGKFFGAFLVAILPYTGIALAALISPYMPWVDATHYGPFSLQANINGFLLFSVFNTLFGGAIIYAFAIYFRNPVLSYIASFGIIILNVMAAVLTKDVENQRLAMLLDPLGQHAFAIFTQYWSPAQRNTGYAGLSSGLFLVNRLLWGSIGVAILFWIYWAFDFTQSRSRPTKKKDRIACRLPMFDASVPCPAASRTVRKNATAPYRDNARRHKRPPPGSRLVPSVCLRTEEHYPQQRLHHPDIHRTTEPDRRPDVLYR